MRFHETAQKFNFFSKMGTKSAIFTVCFMWTWYKKKETGFPLKTVKTLLTFYGWFLKSYFFLSQLHFFYETVLLADFMPKTTYFWQPVSVKLWPFFEFQVSFSVTAVKLRTVSREFRKRRCTSVNLQKTFFVMHKIEKFCNLKMKFVFFFSLFLKNHQIGKKKCWFHIFWNSKKSFFAKSANTFWAGSRFCDRNEWNPSYGEFRPKNSCFWRLKPSHKKKIPPKFEKVGLKPLWFQKKWPNQIL